jgi:hypothetical protein
MILGPGFCRAFCRSLGLRLPWVPVVASVVHAGGLRGLTLCLLPRKRSQGLRTAENASPGATFAAGGRFAYRRDQRTGEPTDRGAGPMSASSACQRGRGIGRIA